MAKSEPKAVREGKTFHREVQAEWLENARGDVAVENRIAKPSGRRGRIDVFVDAEDTLVAIAEIKASDWSRMTASAMRRNVLRHTRQVWDYIESQLAAGKEVNPGVVLGKRPRSRERLHLIEALFEARCIAVVWQDEPIEERRARATL